MASEGDQPYETMFVIWWVLTALFPSLALAMYEPLWALGLLVVMLGLGLAADVKTKGRFSGGGFPFNLVYRFYAS
jgi:MFS superfamily sulfate permease-like transporter